MSEFVCVVVTSQQVGIGEKSMLWRYYSRKHFYNQHQRYLGWVGGY